MKNIGQVLVKCRIPVYGDTVRLHRVVVFDRNHVSEN
jgi:hypothetical protein